MSTKPGATNFPVQSIASSAVGTRAGLVHAGDERPDDPDVGRAQLAAADIDHGAAGEQQVERLASLRGGDRAARTAGSTGSMCMVRSFSADRGGDEVTQYAAQLDGHAIGLHVHLGGEVERQPPVDVALLEREVLVDDLALERDRLGHAVRVASRSLRCTVV